MHQWSIFKKILLYVTGFVNPAASGFLNNVICFVKNGKSVTVCNTTLSLCDTGVVTQISTDIKYSDSPASTQCTSPCTIPSTATAIRSDILDHCYGTKVCTVNNTSISEIKGGALVFNVTCGAATSTSSLSTASSRSPTTVPTSTDSGLSASSQATNPSSTVSNANSSGPNTSSPGPNTSSTGSNASSTGPNTSSTGPNTSSTVPNVSSTGPNTSSTGPNTSSTGPNTSSTVPNVSSTGPNTSSPGPNTSSTGPNASSPGPNVSSTGPNTSSTGPDASSTGPNTSSTGPDASSTGPNTSSTGPNTSSTGPNTSSTGPNTSNTGPNTSSTGPDASSTGPNANSTAFVADSTTAVSLGNESTQAQFSTDSDDPFPAAIIVSVIVSVIIVVLVVAFLMYRKGQCKQLLGKCAKDHRKHSPDRSDEFVMGSMANANLTYDLSSVVDLNNYNEDYSEIDKVDKEHYFEYSQVNFKRKQPVHSLTYNHIGHFDRSSEDTEHTYNHVGDETSPKSDWSTLQPDTYSHVGAMARPASGHLAEDSYAHINGVMKDLPAAYETNQYDCAVFQSNGGQTGNSGHRGNEIKSGKEKKFIVVGPSNMDKDSDAPVSHSYFVLKKHEKED